MAFLDEYKVLLSNCIANGNYVEAEKLVRAYQETQYADDDELCYYKAIVAESKGLYGVTKYYLQRGYAHNSENVAIREYYNLLTGTSIDAVRNVRDLSYSNKRLRIVVMCIEFDVLELFNQEFIDTFETMGHTVLPWTIAEKGSYQKLAAFLQGGVDLVFSFNHLCMEAIDAEGVPLVAKMPCPVVNIAVDHTFFGRARVQDIYSDKRFHLFTVDRDDVKYMNEIAKMNSSNHFIAHGGKALEIERIPLEKREIDVLYVGGTKKYPMTDDVAFNLCAQQMIDNPNLCTKTVVFQVLREILKTQQGLDSVSDDDIIAIVGQDRIDYLYSAELVALGHYRVKAIEMLVNAGVRVHVYGPDWDTVSFANHPNLVNGGYIEPTQCLKKMYDSKIVLNSMPWFKDGSHERIFNAMLAGAICLTDQSKWVLENFENGKELIAFDLQHMEDMVDCVKMVLDNPSSYQVIADKGYQKAVANHTWSHRGLEILDVLYDELFEK